jgi:hypothetical protein
MFQQERAFAFVAAPSQRVRAGQCHQHRLLKQPVDYEPFLIGIRRSDESDIDLFASQQIEQFPAEALLQTDGYQRIGLTKRTNGTRHQRMKWTRGHNPAANSALLASRRAPCRIESMIELSKDRSGIVEKGAPGVGQFDTARLSVKKLDIQLAFDRLDTLTERRLLHAKPLRSPRDVTLLGNSDEILQVPEFHGISLKICILEFAYYGSTFCRMLFDRSTF